MSVADMGEHALGYAARGWPVFPVHSVVDGRCTCGKECGKDAGKHPRTPNGLLDASTDPEVIRRWWQRWPESNIAARTGVAFDVFDVDHDDVHEGAADLPPLEMPGGPVARTGGGWHFYLKPTGMRNRTRFAGACDWRGTGGYVILPPSLHRSGKRYEWFAPSTLALNDAPAALVGVLDARQTTGRTTVSVPRAGGVRDAFVRGWSPAGIIGKMALASDGHRNNTLVWCANRIGLDVHYGKATAAEADQALDDLHRVALSVGLEERAIAATIRSGLAKGVAGRGNGTGGHQ